MKTDPRIHPQPVSHSARRILILHHRALSRLVAIRRTCRPESGTESGPADLAEPRRQEVTV